MPSPSSRPMAISFRWSTPLRPLQSFHQIIFMQLIMNYCYSCCGDGVEFCSILSSGTKCTDVMCRSSPLSLFALLRRSERAQPRWASRARTATCLEFRCPSAGDTPNLCGHLHLRRAKSLDLAIVMTIDYRYIIYR